MAVFLLFADSFAHYDTSFGLKWSSPGGAFETDPAHIRTGPQSLRIQDGDSPSIVNFAYPTNVLNDVGQGPGPGGNVRFVTGFGWQTSSLAGETICELWAYWDIDGAVLLPVPLRQFFLVQNANGSISVWTGNAGGETLIGTTSAGVLTVGPFWYIEFSVNMLTNELVLTVTGAANVATQVLIASGYTTTENHADRFFWGGPSGLDSAWVSDFYLARWDGEAPAVAGAPKIYGEVVPISPDGLGRLGASVSLAPFNETAAPFFSQVNELPQDTADYIGREDVDGFFPFTMGQAFVYDVSSVPDGSEVFAVQAVHMWSMGHDIDGNVPAPTPWAGVGGTGINDYVFSQGKGGLVDSSFLFLTYPFDTNPVSGLPWSLDDFSGPDAMQIGPGVQSSG